MKLPYLMRNFHGIPLGLHIPIATLLQAPGKQPGSNRWGIDGDVRVDGSTLMFDDICIFMNIEDTIVEIHEF